MGGDRVWGLFLWLFLWSRKTNCEFESGLLASDSKTISGKEDAKEMAAKRRVNRTHGMDSLISHAMIEFFGPASAMTKECAIHVMHHSSMNAQRVTRTHGGATWTCGLRYKLAFQQARKQMHTQTQMQGHTYTHMKPHVLTWPRRYFHFFVANPIRKSK